MVDQVRRPSGTRVIVIMSCDSLGAAVAASLSDEGHTVHITDEDPESFDRLPQGRIDDGHIVPTVGDGTQQQDQMRASIQEADVFMALSSVDTRNALAAQIAKNVFQVPTVVCRMDDPDLKTLYNELDIVAISATTLATQQIMEAATA